MIEVGDTIELLVTRVEGYACWGTFDTLVGFVHCAEWSRIKPVPRSLIPRVGDLISVRVFRLVTEPQTNLPLDVTFDGAIHVDFAASRALLEPEPIEIVAGWGSSLQPTGEQDVDPNA